MRTRSELRWGSPDSAQTAAAVGSGLHVLVDQHPREVVCAEAHEIHDEEGEVGRHIDLTQRRIELDGIEHLDPPFIHDHVLGAQIAVAVAHEAARAPFLQHAAAGVEEGDREAVTGGKRSLAHQGEYGSSVPKFSLTVAATASGSKLPVGAGSAPAWKAAIRRATARTVAWSAAPAGTIASSVLSGSNRRISTTCSAPTSPGAPSAHPSAVWTSGRTPRYRSGASRCPSRTSSSHMARRRSAVP